MFASHPIPAMNNRFSHRKFESKDFLLLLTSGGVWSYMHRLQKPSWIHMDSQMAKASLGETDPHPILPSRRQISLYMTDACPSLVHAKGFTVHTYQRCSACMSQVAVPKREWDSTNQCRNQIYSLGILSHSLQQWMMMVSIGLSAFL